MTALTIIGAIGAAVVAAVVAFLLGRSSKPDSVPESEEERKRVLAAADGEADAIKRQAGIEAKEAAQKLRNAVENELRARQHELDRAAAEIRARVEATDRRGARVGYGGGYYDELAAYVKAHPDATAARFIGFAFDFQLVDTCPAGEWDVPLDRIVTNERVVVCDASDE